METVTQSISRLLGALESLTEEEHLLLDQSEFAAADAVREREQPLVARIAEFLFQPGVASSLEPALQIRAQRLLNAQSIQIQRLSARISANREQLSALQNAQARAQRLRPAYGQTHEIPATMSFAGNA